MTAEDSFERDRKIIRPNPGGRRSAKHERAEAPIPDISENADVRTDIPTVGANPLLAAAGPILTLCSELRNTANLADIESLHQRFIGEIPSFENKAFAFYSDTEVVRLACYSLCALIDDVVLNTPWGLNSSWPTNTIVLTFYKETSGGTRFYENLARAEREPAKFLDLLELIYVSLSLGFEGELRNSQNGPAEHTQIRGSLYRTIRNHRSEFERNLSSDLHGLGINQEPLSSHFPVWVIAVFASALMIGAYSGFSYALNEFSDQVYRKLATLPPTNAVVLARDAAPPVTVQPNREKRIWQLLRPEIAQNRVAVFEDTRLIRVRTNGIQLFASGSNTIEPRFISLIRRIGEALETEQGRIIIAGHTDNIPIRTFRFPSNWALSIARANAVQAMLAHFVSNSHRISAEGRGDTEPIASNYTAEGRTQNRRIDITLVKQR